MEWTREQRYRKYKDWDAQTLLDLQAQAATSPYQMHYHIHPLSGLLNDPNGFSYYNGRNQPESDETSKHRRESKPRTMRN